MREAEENMDKIYASTTDEIEQREIDHAEISRQLATECVVLLENDGTLPLKDIGSIALFGAGARGTIKGGTGSGDINSRSVVNIEQGFEEAGVTVTTKAWLDRHEKKTKEHKESYLAWVEEEAEKQKREAFAISFDHPYQPAPAEDILEEDVIGNAADAAVYVIARNSGEGADRFAKEGDYLPFPEEVEQITFLTRHFSKVVLLLNIGGIMDLSGLREIPGLGAILLVSQLGNLGGQAIASVVLGKVTPSGKTTDTWAKNYMDYPSSEKFSHNESVHDELYEDGVYVGYRYFDSFGVEPLYPFGYGLSYTDFSVSAEFVEIMKDRVCVGVSVQNTGKEYAGKEVIQAYVSMVGSGLDLPYQKLAAFAKTKELQPGERQKLMIDFPLTELAYYDGESSSWKIGAGEVLLRIGNSSRHTKVEGVLEIEHDITVYSCRHAFPLDVELKEIKPDQAQLQERIAGEIPAGIRRLKVDASMIKAAAAAYQDKREPYTTTAAKKLTLADIEEGHATVEEMVSQLTVEEMAELCVGTLRGDDSSVVGNASYLVPGAAGDTSSVIRESRGVRNIILADGPAGLRLQPHFKTKKNGELIPGGEILGESFKPFPEDLDESDVIDYYQYCTAIPIGWALAQSWNTELVESAGDMVGKEMEQFGVDLWLAPALNIHRNPLCGRNFEYYSEDPLVSGKIAAAMTNGVQKHPGRGTTIKHFAVNNQEDNRYFVNAHVSERALREIYLKGFEIAVKESQPLSIMTSYNLLNGIHTANHYDLLQTLARDEWGFTGTIMTDWFTSQDMPVVTGKFKNRYPISSSVGCIYAGNDIQMPGCQKNVDDIVEAVKTGKEIDGFTITLADLQYCAANIIRVIKKM
jgi:beta-glucosidase